MASSDPTGLFIVGIILLLFLGGIAYVFLGKRLADNKRNQLIQAFKAAPKIAKGAPVLVQGPAASPDVLLPTTGEHVAYYSLFVLSKESTITGSRSRTRIRINGIPLGSDGDRIEAVEGFMFYETSGDFTVSSGGTDYRVAATGVFAYFKKGADIVSGFVAGQFKSAGLPEEFFYDTMNVSIAQQALRMLCGFEAPIVTERSQRFSGSGNRTTTTKRTTFSVVTATSRIDARVHHYLSGFSLPQGVMGLIAQRGIELPEKEEIIVVETFIPLNREVFVFGTFDGNNTIVYADGTVQLSVSYTDPGV
jgi:hypothetical protein